MPLSGTPLTSVSAEQLAALVDDRVQESRRVEFKSQVGTDGEARREFLADVSSFANATGGDILIGVGADAGVATSLPGLDDDQSDNEVLRLENLVRDGIDPRLPGLQVRPIPLGNGRVVLIVRVPRSWAAPHMVTFRGHSRFYSRNSAGKYPLDVGEIRAAFVASVEAGDRLRQLRQERLARVISDDVIPMHPGGRLVLHVFPFSALEAGGQVDVVALGSRREHRELFVPMYEMGWNTRVTFDGALAVGANHGGAVSSYTLVMRSGAIESVEGSLLVPGNEHRLLPSAVIERELIGALERSVALLSEIGASPPTVVGLSLLGVRGTRLAAPRERFPFRDHAEPFDRDDLLVPEILLDSLVVDAANALRPAFDAVWNAGGVAGSPYYGEDGAWREPRH